MRNYFIDGAGGWCVVSTRNKREARHAAVVEFGRGAVREVRPATEDEVKEYVRLKGERALQVD